MMNTLLREVVILNDFASSTGGSSAVAIASAVGLARQGIQVTYFSCVGPIAPQLRAEPNITAICLQQKDIGHQSNPVRAAIDGWRNAPAIARLRTLLATKNPNCTVVHAHTWSQALSPFALSTVTDAGFRLVVTLHDFFTACPNGQFFDYRKNQLCERRPLSLSCWSCNCDRRNFAQKLWRNARSTMQNRFLRVLQKASYFVGVSEFSLSILRPHLPPSVPTRVVRNPIDCIQGKPANISEHDDFLFIGRFEKEKGAMLFAEAAMQAGVAATFIGDGALMPQLRSRYPGSRFTGWLPANEIQAQLKRARALVFPSLWHETLGMVVVEAAAAGVPAIVSDRCAATEYISHETNGLHFSHGSADSLAEQLRRLAADANLAARLGKAGYEWYWRAPWTADQHITELFDIYNCVVAPAPLAAKGENNYESAGRIRAWS